MRDKVDAVITVSEEEIVAAMRLCFERMNVRPTACTNVVPMGRCLLLRLTIITMMHNDQVYAHQMW